jgi:spore germination protein
VFRLLKFWIIFTSALWGLYGFWLGLMAIFIHLSGLNSFGQPYMLPGINGENINNDLDYVVKAPIDKLVKRPIWVNAENKVRLRKK